MHLKIRRQNGVESLTTLEEGEFKLVIDGCIKSVSVLQPCNVARSTTPAILPDAHFVANWEKMGTKKEKERTSVILGIYTF